MAGASPTPIAEGNDCVWQFDAASNLWVPISYCHSGYECGPGPQDRPMSAHPSLTTGGMEKRVKAYNAKHHKTYSVPAAPITGTTVTLHCVVVATPNPGGL